MESAGLKEEPESRVSGLLASLDLLAKASADLLHPSSDLARILPTILKVAQALIAADAYAVWRVRPDGSWAILAGSGLSAEYQANTIPAANRQEMSRTTIVLPDVFTAELVSGRRDLYAKEGIVGLMAAPLLIDNEVIGSLTFYFRARREASEDDVHLATALANLTASAIAMSEIRRQEERTRNRLEFLAEASAVLSSSLDYEATLKTVTGLAVPEVADWCAVDIYEDGELHRVGIAHVDAEKLALAREYRRLYPPDWQTDNGVCAVIRSGKAQYVPHVTADMLSASIKDERHSAMLRELGVQSVVIVPLTGRDRILGAITLVASGRDLDPLDFKLAEDLSRRAATAIENARLFRMVEQSEVKFRTMTDTVPCAIYIHDSKRLLYVNKAAEELSGYTAEELAQIGMFDLVHPDHRDMVMKRAAARLRGESQTSRYEFKGVRKDGTARWLDFAGAVINYEGRLALLATAFDITDRKLGQEKIERSEREARTLLSNLPDVIARYGPDLRYEYMSPNVERITGIRAEDFIGKSHSETGLPAHLCEFFDDSLRKIFGTGQPDQIEFTTVGSDGETKKLVGLGIPLFDSDGAVAQVLTITHDLTAFRKAEEAVARSEKELRLLIDSLPALVAYVDTEERFRRVNRTFEQWFQRPISEFVGRTIREVLGDNYSRVKDHVAQVLRGEVVQYEVTNDYADKRRHVLITYVPDFDEAGSVRGFAALVQDISERRIAEEAIRRTEKLAAVGRMAASISHEINNPLESVTNLVFLAKNDSGMPKRSREFLETAERELARVSQIATQTLRFHRQSGRPTRFDLGELIDSVLTLYEGRFSNSQVSVRREYQQAGEMEALEGELRQVLANLVGNAIDASSSGGVIIVRASRISIGKRSERMVRVTVADNGHGISPELRTRIFEPFFTTKTSTGTGLGLWVTREIIDKHRGRIRVRSCTQPGRSGTVFSIYLPERFAG